MDGLEVATERKRLKPKTPVIILFGYPAILDEGVGKVDLWLRKGGGGAITMAVA
jgi:hypothetical protein